MASRPITPLSTTPRSAPLFGSGRVHHRHQVIDLVLDRWGGVVAITFHAVVVKHKTGHAFSLTDEPFEQVPQGGPDLTANQARAHEFARR